MTDNHAREGGGAIFFVSNDRTGDLLIRSSRLKGNPSDGFENSPGIFFLGDRQVVEDSSSGSYPTSKVHTSGWSPGFVLASKRLPATSVTRVFTLTL